MRILNMTATFGKLDHETLPLEPGLNLLYAPNEWGKSTWCAFLLAMLYGIDTGSRRSKSALPDKERYRCWSGAPMSGRMDVEWQGRKITLERTSKGRIPLGQFRAYETETGIPVPELTAENCGRLLIGEPGEVYKRSGFIRFADLPVTGDEGFRARLNALVTTGEDSPEMRKLRQDLKNLKNRCRYNQSGRLPQLEEEREDLRRSLSQREETEASADSCRQALGELDNRTRVLQNHLTALEWEKNQDTLRRIAQAEALYQEAERRARLLEQQTSALPSEEALNDKSRQLTRLLLDWKQSRSAPIPEKPLPPVPPTEFAGLTGAQAAARVREDTARYHRLGVPLFLLPLLLGSVCLLSAGALFYFDASLAALFFGILGACGVVSGVVWRLRCRSGREALLRKYHYASPDAWGGRLARYTASLDAYARAEKNWEDNSRELQETQSRLAEQKSRLCGVREPEELLAETSAQVQLLLDAKNARREADMHRQHLADLQGVLVSCAAPSQPDTLTDSPEDTRAALRQVQRQAAALRSQADRAEGALQKLPTREALERALQDTENKIHTVTQISRAADLALECLEKAQQELQRRFAPQIAGQAQRYMAQITGGRYDRMLLGSDLSIQTAARQEDTLRSLLWRSDGTEDQLYLALRLAVAQQMLPNAPLVLDDALVRCDDKRMGAILDLLKELSKSRQILLFTCQTREEAYLNR